MLVHATFHIHPDHKEQAKSEVRKIKAVIEKHGGRNLKYNVSMTSGTPNRMFTYEIDKFAHLDTLHADPEFRAIKLDSLYTNSAISMWGEVEV